MKKKKKKKKKKKSMNKRETRGRVSPMEGELSASHVDRVREKECERKNCTTERQRSEVGVKTEVCANEE